MGEYLVRCVSDGSVQPPYSLSCPHDNSLLRAEYKARQLRLRDLPGIWRFRDWLPVTGIIAEADGKSVTYKSRGLAEELNLKNLYISFNGYWPEQGARMPTCSFKDLEAATTLERLLEQGGSSTLVWPRPGTQPALLPMSHHSQASHWSLFVPEMALERMWTTVPPANLTLIAVQGDYYNAIQVAEKVQTRPGFTPEGGARNIARRDGMGTVMLDAATTLGRLPRHYFQRWEAAREAYPPGKPRSASKRTVALGQTSPGFTWPRMSPMHPSTMPGRVRNPYPRKRICSMTCSSTANRLSGIPGGVKDALEAERRGLRHYGQRGLRCQKAL